MPKMVITGNTRGIGKKFAEHFLNKGWEVIGFNTLTGLEDVVHKCQDCDLFINNAYAEGRQLEFLNLLYDKVKKIIICGSVAAFNPDPMLPEYSRNKKNLYDRTKQLLNYNILMLHLSAKGYNDPEGLCKLIDIWLEHPCVTEIFFDPSGDPNE